MSAPIHVAIVEDNPNIRDELVELVGDDPGLKLAGFFKDGPAALRGIPKLRPEVVIMDIELPGIDGVECVRKLKAQLPAINFLMLTVYEDSDKLFESLKAGAGGYLLKRNSSTHLARAIHELNAGGSPMTPHIARQVVEFFSGMAKPSAGSGSDLTSILASLTPGQRKTLDELAQGYGYKEIAEHLGITVDGVRNHIRVVYERLHVHSRTEAVIKYLKR